MGSDEHLTELNEAARRAGRIVTEQIDSIIERAERQAETIRREAEQDAEHMRREAVDAAKRLLDRLHALEFPLGELVASLRDEVELASRELERGEHVDSHATSLPPGSESAHAETGQEEVASEREGGPAPEEGSATDADLPVEEPPLQPSESEPAPPDASEPEPVLDEPEPVMDEPEPVMDEPEPVMAAGHDRPPRGEGWGKVGRRGRRRERTKQPKGPFITSEGHCAVCHRAFRAGSEDALKVSGWRVNGDVGLCPDCQADAWQLPDGARLPARRGGR